MPKGVLIGPSCLGHCCSRIDSISVRLQGQTIVEDVSLHLHCGEILGIVGPNGGGKSTLLKALTGEVDHQGKVEFLAADGTLLPAPRIGYVPQSLRFEAGVPMTVLDLFAATLSRRPLWMGVAGKIRQKAYQLLKEVEAQDLLDKKVSVLSGGELQRVMLALALEPMPNLLLLDEPISGMDANGRRRFYALVDRIRKVHDLSVILVSHDFGEIAPFADRLLLLHVRTLALGTPQVVMASPEFQSLFSYGGISP